MRIKRFISVVITLTTMLFCMSFPNYIPFSKSYNEIVASAFSLKESYSNSAVYTAESIINGLIDLETGSYSVSVTKYSDVIERNYAYEQLAKNVMEDKGLVITSTMWDTFNKALSGKLVSAVDTEFRQEQIYEVFLMDYLTFSEGSTENSSFLDKSEDFADKTMKYESKVFKQLLNKGIAHDEKSLVELIESSDSLNDTKIVEAMKELNWEKKLVGYTKVLDKITSVATNANDYLEAITKAMALKEVNDERIEFLKSMAAKASDDEAFQTAVANIIDTIESSYGEIAFSEGVKKIGTISWDKCWGAITKKIPFFSTFKNVKDAMNYLFNNDSMAENNIRIIMQYTAGQYAQQVLNSAYYAYKIDPTEKNAEAFNEAYKNYLAYQDYSSEWAKNFVEAVPFASSTTVDAWLSDLNTDINYCNSAIGFIDKYTDIYNKAVYYPTSIIKPSGTISEDPNNPVTPPSGTVEKDIIETGQLGDYVHYTLYDNGYLDIGGIGDMGDDYFDSPILNESLVEIVSIAEGVTSIGYRVFEDCTSLKSIRIPDSVTAIDSCAFAGCTSLKSITIPGSVEKIYDGAFSGCTSLTSITIPDSVVIIGSYAFEGCGFTSVTIPDTVDYIGTSIFRNCKNLKYAFINGNLSDASEKLFEYCPSLEYITFSEPCVVYNMFTWDETDELAKDNSYFKNTDWISGSHYYYPVSLKSVKILSGTEVPNHAFYGMESLEEIILPDTIDTIGNYAFYHCSGLTAIPLPPKVKVINESVFHGCAGCTEINIPDGIEIICGDAFGECSNATTLTIPSSVKQIGSLDPDYICVGGAFNSCGFKSITLPETLECVGSETFAYCENLEEITIPSGIAIGTEILKCCPSIKKMTIVDGDVRSITEYFSYLGWTENDNRFYGVYDRRFRADLGVPYSLKTITVLKGDCYLSGFSSLTEVNLPKNMKEIDPYAFYNCTGLTKITIPESVTIIGDYSFMGSGLTSITLPDSVAKIGQFGFCCPELTSVTILNKDCDIFDESYTISENAVIYGYTNSTAQAYAEKYNREFVSLDKPATTTTSTTTTSKTTTSTTTTSTTTTSKTTTSTSTTSTTTTSKTTTSTSTTSTTTTSKTTTSTTTTSTTTTSKTTTSTSTTSTTITSKTTTSTSTTSTTTTSKTTTSTTTTSTTTTSKTTTSTSTTSTTTISHIASDEEICNWTINDYHSKTGITPEKAEINKILDEKYEIILTDNSGKVLDTYVIDPDTGTGTDSDNEEVDLPQTGNNSLKDIIIIICAFMTIVIGLCALKLSGIYNHKKDEQ